MADIDRAWEAVKHAPQGRIHTFIGTSPLHRDITALDMDGMVARIHETVAHARNLCDDVQWSPMDATRTEHDFLCRVVETAIKAGATTINIPDTVGYTYPRESADLIAMLWSVCRAPMRSPSPRIATTIWAWRPPTRLAAVEAGARQVECTINGLGERAGNTALEEVVMALRVRGDILPYATRIDTTKIMGLSRMVAAVSGFPVQYNKAVVGKNAFAHESGIHQDGMLKNKETFEIMRPEDIGLAATNLVMGKHSGRAALRAKLSELGYELGDNQLKDVFVRFKALADRKKEVYDDDLIALMAEASLSDEDAYLQVKRLRVICGTDGPQEAELTMRSGGEEKFVDATGDGPVDATFNAVKMLHPHDARLELYQVHAVTEGTDAQATVSVRLALDGIVYSGQSSDTDTVVASAKAYVNALNRLVMHQHRGNLSALMSSAG